MDIEETFLFKDCLKNCPSSELKLNLKTELEIVKDSDIFINWDVYLNEAFNWANSPQGDEFWHSIYRRVIPKEYQ